ncbi:MAG: hypothetical protein ACOYL7_03820 [Caldilinea sp.]
MRRTWSQYRAAGTPLSNSPARPPLSPWHAPRVSTAQLSARVFCWWGAWEAGGLPDLAVPAASCAALRPGKRLTGLFFHRLLGAGPTRSTPAQRRERARGRRQTLAHETGH